LIPSFVLAWSGTVIGVSDGNTITVLRDNKPIKGRIYVIDCPERSQAFGTRAKQSTSEMVFKKNVEIKCGGPQKMDNVLSSGLHPKRRFSQSRNEDSTTRNSWPKWRWPP